MADSTGHSSQPMDHGKEIISQPQSTNLLTLNPTDFGKSLYVKVYRKWTTTNKASVPVMHHCILLDQQVHFYVHTQNYTTKLLTYYPINLFREEQSKQT